MDVEAAAAALESLTAGDKRGEVIEIKGATILNDCYNSNPEALRSMIRTLAARPAKRQDSGGRGDAGDGRARPGAAHGLRARRRRGGAWI